MQIEQPAPLTKQGRREMCTWHSVQGHSLAPDYGATPNANTTQARQELPANGA